MLHIITIFVDKVLNRTKTNSGIKVSSPTSLQNSELKFLI